MKESYREGVANHSGPEPCEDGREAALEALDRGICRLGIELRNRRYREPTCPASRKHKTRCAKRCECTATLRRAVKNDILKSAEKMPQENYGFKPAPRVRTF